jgi:hypothetical protein
VLDARADTTDHILNASFCTQLVSGGSAGMPFICSVYRRGCKAKIGEYYSITPFDNIILRFVRNFLWCIISHASSSISWIFVGFRSGGMKHSDLSNMSAGMGIWSC